MGLIKQKQKENKNYTMEVPRGNDRKALVATYELFGTAIFLYMILVSTGDQFAVPLALYAAILIFGGITGGHFNPAVTTGVFIHNKKWSADLPYALLIIVSQLIGACLGMIFAAFTLSAKIDGERRIPDHRVPILAPMGVDGTVDKYDEDGFTEDW